MNWRIFHFKKHLKIGVVKIYSFSIKNVEFDFQLIFGKLELSTEITIISRYKRWFVHYIDYFTQIKVIINKIEYEKNIDYSDFQV